MRLLLACVLLLILGSAGRAQDGTRFTGADGIYSLEPPPGWARFETSDAEAAFAAPDGGTARGTIFVSTWAAIGTLDAEAEEIAQGEPRQDQRALAIGGLPCLAFWWRDSVSHNNALVCQFLVPAGDRPALTSFALGSTSAPEDAREHTADFWDMARTLRWRADLSP